MNDTLGNALLNGGNCFYKLVSGLVRRSASDFVPDFLDRFLCACLIPLVPQSLDFTLLGPLKG